MAVVRQVHEEVAGFGSLGDPAFDTLNRCLEHLFARAAPYAIVLDQLQEDECSRHPVQKLIALTAPTSRRRHAMVASRGSRQQRVELGVARTKPFEDEGSTCKAEALLAEKAAREALLSGARKTLFREGYAEYMAATPMKPRARDAYEHVWKRIEPELGHLYIETVDTSAIDSFKRKLPSKLAPRSINHYLILIRAVLRFLWKRSRLKHVPYVPMESVPKAHVDWYTAQERDQLLEGMFRLEPQWYLFYYLTARLGLRTVYAISHRQIRQEPPQLVVDQSVQRGTKAREAKLAARKNDEAYVLDITPDWLRWNGTKARATEVPSFSSPRPPCSRVTSTARPPPPARAAEARDADAQPPQVGAAFGRQLSRHERGVDQGGAGPARPQVRAEHAPILAPRGGRSETVDRGADSGNRSARESARSGRQRRVNERCESSARGCGRQRGVNGRSEHAHGGRITKVKRPRFHRAFSSVARGRNHTWTTGFTVPIEVRVARRNTGCGWLPALARPARASTL